MRFFCLLVLLTSAQCLFGQSSVYVDAKPKLDLTCPDMLVSVGEQFTVKALFGPVNSATPAYEWSLSAGTIVAGQGTPTLIVRADTGGVPITASLNIGGGPFWYEPLTETCTTNVAMKPEARLLGEFGIKNIGYVELMFDGLFKELWDDPSASGLIAFSGPNQKERRRLKRLADRLIKMRKFDRTRLTFVDGERTSLGEFRIWVLPVGAETPANLTVDPDKN